MAASFQAFRKELDFYLDETLGVEGRRDVFLSFAVEEAEKFEADWIAALADVGFAYFVDGVAFGNAENVRIPGGVIVEVADPIRPIVKRAVELFDRFTKVVTGGFKSQTHLFVNDARADGAIDNITKSDLVVIGNISSFARKAEQRGFSVAEGAGFTGGLFESIAAILKKEFRGANVPIFFTYRDLAGERVPIVAIGEGATNAGRRRLGDAKGARGGRTFAQEYARKKGR